MGIRPHSEAEKPYDTTLEDNISMYDKLPYKRNEDLCNVSTLALNSGNLVKFYRCTDTEEAKEIKNQDEAFSKIVSEHLDAQAKSISELHAHYPVLFGVLEDKENSDNSYEEEYEEAGDDEISSDDEE